MVAILVIVGIILVINIFALFYCCEKQRNTKQEGKTTTGVDNQGATAWIHV